MKNIIDAIKKWLVDKPKWVKIVCIIVCSLGVGLATWFGITSCASLSVGSMKVKTDKVEVEGNDINIKNKDPKLSFANDVYSECLKTSNYAELVEVLDSYGFTTKTWYDFLNGNNMIALEREICYVN